MKKSLKLKPTVVRTISMPMVPYTLALFVGYFSGQKTHEAIKYGHIYNLVMNLCIVTVPLLMNHLELLQGCVGMRVRIACCSLVYRKVLKLNHNGLNKTEAGQIINLMSNDVSRFDIASLYLHYIWVMPILIIYVSYLVWQHIAWATLAGLGVIFLQTLLMQSYLSVLQTNLRKKIAKRTDERVKVMSELINGVQVIKMYAWEKSFENLVAKLRKYEMKFISQTSMIKGFSTALMVFTERLVLFAAIVTFTACGGEIRSAIAFSLVQYYNLLQRACNILFPWALTFFGESNISVKRLEEFLLLEEVENKKVLNNIDETLNEGLKEPLLESDHKCHEKSFAEFDLITATTSWQPSSATKALKNVSLKVRSGEFVGIVGSVGSGKSSLLQVILGELQLSDGELLLSNVRISYASQEPWLFAGTVRQNVLFGLPYNKLLYNKVIHACALLHDIEQLPDGDASMVGERGVSLSGGQRARIGLARACYREADIYLLDDPLSAVDTHVGKHLVSECVMGLLRHSTRILVTHQLHHLKTADKVVILENGEIEAQGTYEEMSEIPLFRKLTAYKETDINDSTDTPDFGNQKLSAHEHENHLNMRLEGDDEDRPEPEESDELMEKGRVSYSGYSKYFSAAGIWMPLVLTLMSILLAQVVTSISDLWFAYWVNNVEASLKEVDDSQLKGGRTIVLGDANNSASFTITSKITSNRDDNHFAHSYYIYVWSAILLGCILFTTGRSFLFMHVCMRSSINLHNRMLSNILTATMQFFNTNASGRILNRFSKDLGVVDEVLPKMFIESIQIAMVTCGILTIVAIVNPYMVLAALLCAIFMYLWSALYISTAQSIKRLEGVTRSPVFSHVSASMAGLTTVRACGAQHMLLTQFDDKQDVHTAAWYMMLITNTSFAIWLSFIAAIYIFIVTNTFLLLDDGTTKSGNVGLAVSQALVLINMLQYGIKQLTQVVSQMTSAERILEYTDLPQEISKNTSPPRNWPEHGRVVLKDVYLRYDKENEPVLKNLNIMIESGWKVGVVGRTGAGKSSLISALFRLAQIDGHVYIDDVDTGDIALKDLRSKISIIPQEPVLFSASLRYNLDPFDKYSDADIWSALEQVKLKNKIKSLSMVVESGGSNFSAGERQLLCLARAALASNRILILDEATANVDPNTDSLIQKSIRKHFCDCTIITVAHRLHTVADSDCIIVMKDGQVVEFGHPSELLQKEEGQFIEMINELDAAAKNAFVT